MTADQLIESLRLSGRSDALNGAVENKNLPLHLRNEIEAAQNACMAAVRYLSEKPQAPAEAHGDLLDIVLAQEDANLLRRLIGDGDDAASVRLTIGEGHTGYGLYVSEADYPEEGAVLLHPMTRPDKPQPKGTVPGWVIEAMQEALSVCDSVSMSRDRRVVRDGCVLYLQTEEWCQWAEQEVAPKMRAALAAVQHAAEATAQAPAPEHGPSLPSGWRVQRNEDGSIGLFAPPPVDGESRRTSELFTGKLGSDMNEIVFKLLTHMLDATQAPAVGDAS